MLIVQMAPAKINLTLEVFGERPDGYHEVRSVMQTVSLCDSLSFETSERLEVKSNWAFWRYEESLVSKAVEALRAMTGCRQSALIEVNKRIPMMAGLGGDSSDAAATLVGLNRLWGLGLSKEKLVEMAVQLGSDVPFFLYGGTALAEGRGEVITPLPALPPAWFVIILPAIPRVAGKTKQLYESLKPSHFTDGGITSRFIEELNAGRGLSPSLLFNTFENVAYDMFPGLDVFREHVRKIGAENLHLAGSGPALFAMMENRSAGEELFARLKNPEVRLVRTLEELVTRTRNESMAVYLAETYTPGQDLS